MKVTIKCECGHEVEIDLNKTIVSCHDFIIREDEFDNVTIECQKCELRQDIN